MIPGVRRGQGRTIMKRIVLTTVFVLIIAIMISCSGDTNKSNANEHDGKRIIANLVFSPDSGAYSGPQTVTISTTTPGAVIRYTLDGSAPYTRFFLTGRKDILQ